MRCTFRGVSAGYQFYAFLEEKNLIMHEVIKPIEVILKLCILDYFNNFLITKRNPMFFIYKCDKLGNRTLFIWGSVNQNILNDFSNNLLYIIESALKSKFYRSGMSEIFDFFCIFAV